MYVLDTPEVPEAARIDTTTLSGRWLCDGQILQWAGPLNEVRSPVCRLGPEGPERIVVGHEPMLDAEASMRALNAAKHAWAEGRGAWPTARVATRVQAVERFAQLMRQHREEVVRLLMWEIAKTRTDAESEFDRTVQYILDTAEAVKELDRTSARFALEEGFLGQIRRSPLGVTLCMGPFNYPLNETFTTLIPALIMGNTAVVKLPRHGGLSMSPLYPAFAEAFPPGVVNIFQGDGATTISPLMASGDIDVLAFIGTSRVANILQRQHPRPNRLRGILGLEAKNPAIILPDADLDVAVRECVSGALSFNGQRCTAIKLVFVHKDVADQFVPRFTAAVDALVPGLPWTPGARITPLPEVDKRKTLQSLVDDAVERGAAVVNSWPHGERSAGTFFAPAVVYPVTPDMRLHHEEQFGPIVPIVTFESDTEIDQFMRHSPYGQQVALFGRDPRRLGTLVDALVNQVCRINLNSQCRRGPDTFPFNGRKDSAEGTLSVTDALRAFSIRTVVAASSSPDNKTLVTDIVTTRASRFLSTDFLF